MNGFFSAHSPLARNNPVPWPLQSGWETLASHGQFDEHWSLCHNHSPLSYWHTDTQTCSLILKHTKCVPTFEPL